MVRPLVTERSELADEAVHNNLCPRDSLTTQLVEDASTALHSEEIGIVALQLAISRGVVHYLGPPSTLKWSSAASLERRLLPVSIAPDDGLPLLAWLVLTLSRHSALSSTAEFIFLAESPGESI